MKLAPLPLAPRPYQGEAISSWIKRVAARYSLTGDELATFILGSPRADFNTSTIDYRCYDDLEAGLAMSVRLSRRKISSMRLVAHDGSTSNWHRHESAWCVDCLREDIALYKENYERAEWRLGCYVICPVHNRRLFTTCIHCSRGATCSYQPCDGLLRLACCGEERHRLNPAESLTHCQEIAEIYFGIEFTPEMKRSVSQLQRDLLIELSCTQPTPRKRKDVTPCRLLPIAEIITRAVVLSHGIRYQPRIARLLAKRGVITPAALPIDLALGVMAIIAVFADRPESHTMWRPAGQPEMLDRSAFIRWLRKPARNLINRRLDVRRGRLRFTPARTAPR